jgi:hypothetical protein
MFIVFSNSRLTIFIMKNIQANPTAAFKPNTIDGQFDYQTYIFQLEDTISDIKSSSDNGDIAAEQYLEQEQFKVRYNVAMELLARENAQKEKSDRDDKLVDLVSTYQNYIAQDTQIILGEKDGKLHDIHPEPDYDILEQSPIYPYEQDLGLSMEDKKNMMKHVVQYLRERNVYVVFSKTIQDADADDSKGSYIQLGENGERELPIGELVGNIILINPWNVDFISSFLTIGHLYGHMVQEMHLPEVQGIREFLAYPKPLDINLVQKNYRHKYGRSDYKDDFKHFEEEAFAYAKYSFQEAGINWNEKLEYAMRVYIETDFDELWRWATEMPEKEAKAFMELYNEYYEKYKDLFPPLQAKKIDILVTESQSDNISVVRDNKY